MTIRIALAGFSHETNTFAPWPTDEAQFRANGWYEGSELLGLAGTNTVVGGAVVEARSYPDVELLPIVATSAIPGGKVTAGAVEAVEGRIATGLRANPPDAVVLDLHGAMVTELGDDGESGTMRRVRDIVGPNVPIVAVFDLHLNCSAEMVELADVVVPYNTYPHVDSAERGAEALRLAHSIALGKIHPTAAFVKLPMMPPGPKQFSGSEPTRSIMAKAFAMEALPGVVNVGVCYAFGYADIPFPGMAVVVTTDNDQALAQELADELSDYIWDRREEFIPETMTVEEAIHAAMAEPEGPVILADLGDNPGGGSACDGTALLWGLLDLGAQNAAFGLIADPSAVAAAFDAGLGAEIQIELGGKTDDLHGYPVPVNATVQSLSNGDFVYEGPMNAGTHDTLGRTAVLACRGRHGNIVEVIVTERRVQPLDAAVFRSQGIEPTAKQIVVVKSWVHFRGSFMPLAKRIIEVNTPGLTAVDFTKFTYHRIPRPIWPLDEMTSRHVATAE